MTKQSKLEKAIELHKKGALREAEKLYLAIVRETPENADALHFLGVVSHQLGESEVAISRIRQSLDLAPDNHHAYNNLGNVFKENGSTEQAQECYRRALELKPDNPEALSNMAIVLRSKGKLRQAYETNLKSIAANPGRAIAWLNLGDTLLQATHFEAAMEAYRKAIDLDPHLIPAYLSMCRALQIIECKSGHQQDVRKHLADVYEEWLGNEPENPFPRYMLAACRAEKSIQRAPDEFVRVSFDGFAGSFDRQLEKLDYQVPRLIAERLQARFGSAPRSLDVLDAGCGTGLCGLQLRGLANCLVGVDLSPGMLRKARERLIYDELHVVELKQFMETHASTFDLIVASDTLCYFGDLQKVSCAAATSLRAGGIFVFSLEKLGGKQSKEFLLNASGRFSHSESHVRSCLATAGFRGIDISHENLRKEGGEYVAGLIVQAER